MERLVILPGPPVNVALKAGDSYINLTWEPPTFNGGANIDHYNIYRVFNGVGLNMPFKTGGAVLFFNDTSLANNITYFYTISAVNSKGEGVKSIEVNGTLKLLDHTNLAPIAKINEYRALNNSWHAPITVTFNGSGTDPDGRIVSYFWDFGDGFTSTDQNPTHTFTKPGEYLVKLYVFDDDNASGTTAVTIIVKESEQPPPDDSPSGDEEKDASSYAGVAGATIALGLIIIVLMLIKWPMVLKRSTKGGSKVRRLKEYTRRQKKLKHTDDTDSLDEEEIEE